MLSVLLCILNCLFVQNSLGSAPEYLAPCAAVSRYSLCNVCSLVEVPNLINVSFFRAFRICGELFSRTDLPGRKREREQKGREGGGESIKHLKKDRGGERDRRHKVANDWVAIRFRRFPRLILIQ